MASELVASLSGGSPRCTVAVGQCGFPFRGTASVDSYASAQAVCLTPHVPQGHINSTNVDRIVGASRGCETDEGGFLLCLHCLGVRAYYALLFCSAGQL